MAAWRFVTRFALVVCLGSGALPVGASQERTLVVVHSDDPGGFERAAAALESAGARLPHRMPPLLAGFVPPGLERRFVAPEGITVEFERPEGGRDAGPRLRGLPPGAGAMRLFVRGPRVAPIRPEPAALAGDLVEALPGEREAVPKSFSPTDCERPRATSAYLVGAVAIGIVMPESVGSDDTEDWSNPDTRPAHAGDDRRDLVVAEIMDGCDTLVATQPLASLSFYYDVHRDVPVDVEPINTTVGQRGDWISPALESMGYGARAEVSGVHGWLNELRERFDTDWAAAAFVADDLNDTDNGFPPTGFPFAYALLGGPYMVMTYDNDGWSIDAMDVVFRHEFGHVFNALDEYRSAGNSCAQQAGYLRTPNANNDSPPGDPDCLSSVPCIMRANATPDMCTFTRGQVGIRDTDGDTIPDVRDAPPSSAFDVPDPLLLETDGATLPGLVSGRATEGEIDSAPTAYFVNRVVSAEWSLDGGPWQAALADDGAFGGRCEAVTIALAGLSEGWHSVLLRGTSDVGMLEPSPAEARLYVNTDCPDDAGEPDDDDSSAIARPAGVHAGLHHCAFDPDWSRFHLGAGAAATLTLTYDEALADLFLRVVDASLGEVASATGSAGVATAAFTAPRAGTYYAIVQGTGEGESDYSLEIDAPCVDDPGEPDGTIATGQEVVPGTVRDLSLCRGDRDHFLVSLQGGQSVAATITFDPALGNLDLELLDPTGASVSTSTGTGGTETVTAMPTLQGVYAVRVFGATPADEDVYDLDVVATGCIDDVRENDDTAATAPPARPEERGVVCGLDVDWRSFDLLEPRLVRARLFQDPADDDLELELWNDTGTALLGRALTGAGVDDLTRDRLGPGSYRLRIRAGSGAASGVRYRLTFQAEDPLLLFVNKDPHDALLYWNDAGQECYVVRRSEDPSDFSSAVVRIVNEDDPSVPDGDHAIEDLSMRDRDVIFDGRFLYCYLVSPSDCGASLVGSTKTADPYPVAGGIGTALQVDFAIDVRNDGVLDVFNATVRDDIPQNAGSFTILETPPGSTDVSIPAPGGTYSRGQIVVTGIDVPVGQSRRVKFRVVPDRNMIIELPVISNQAQIEHGGSPSSPPTITLTDDPATTAWQDETRVLVTPYTQGFRAHAFWHREVDFDLRVTDTCGNVIGEHDLSMATCSGATLNMFRRHSCDFPDQRYEAVFSFNILPPGDYLVEVTYRESLSENSACGGRGRDEVTVVLQTQDFRTLYRTLSLTPSPTPVVAFVYTVP